MGVVLSYAEFGNAEAFPVLLSSSIGSSRVMWSHQVEPISTHHRTLLLDHRGHGQSPMPDGPYEMSDLAEDVIATMDSLGIERADFVGLSLGGMVGMWLGSHYPERIRRLVLACTTPYMPPPELWLERAAKVMEHGMESIQDAVFARWFTETFASEHPDQVSPLREQFLMTSPYGYSQCGLAISRMDQRESLASITAPTLVIAGSDDPATTPETCHDLAAAIPGAIFAEVEASHIAAVEAADDFTELVLEHLSKG